MVQKREAFDGKGVPIGEEIDAATILSRWYGQESIACHKIKILDERTAESVFVVPPGLCGLAARPPMLDRLRYENGVFRTKTSPEDAREHFIESVDLQVVPGHNITGLVAEALEQVYYQNQERYGEFYIAGFDAMRFRKAVFPGQEIVFSGTMERASHGISGTFTMEGGKIPFTQNFRCEERDTPGPQLQKRRLLQHWLFEVHAQGLGMFGLARGLPEGIVPILMEARHSEFAPIPVFTGDVITSRFALRIADGQQLRGNAESYINERQVGYQEGILLQFVQMQVIRDAARRNTQETN